MKTNFCIALLILVGCQAYPQQHDTVVSTTDIDHFWVAYDSIRATDQFHRKIELINRLYIQPGTPGLHAFMRVRQYNDSLWVRLIDRFPRFWNSIRANTLQVKLHTDEIARSIERLRQLYPQLAPADIYFTVGGLRSGGTVDGNRVLVGVEIATGDPTTDVSEFKGEWLKNVFKHQSADNLVSLNIHEYVHTQQRGNASEWLLSQSIREGACDFITELVMGRPLERSYLAYGRKNQAAVKEAFRKEMDTRGYQNWLYNGGQQGEAADLGYYIGYEICQAYYQRAADKQQAVRDIIELDYGNEATVRAFLARSGFYE